jgi:hypothetical protein
MNFRFFVFTIITSQLSQSETLMSLKNATGDPGHGEVG